MRCPQCGCKMFADSCPYCHISVDDVKNASNKLAKDNILHGKRDKVMLSPVLPNDINKVALILFLFLGGFVGLDSFYIGRYIKGTLCFVSYIITLGLIAIQSVYPSTAISICVEIGYIWCALVIVIWFVNMISFIFKGYKVPVSIIEKKNEKMKNGKTK